MIRYCKQGCQMLYCDVDASKSLERDFTAQNVCAAIQDVVAQTACAGKDYGDVVLICGTVPPLEWIAQKFSMHGGLLDVPPKRVIIVNLLSTELTRSPPIVLDTPQCPQIIIVQGG